MNVGPPLPLAIEPLALRLVQAALELEEDANACALNPVPRTFDDMMLSMRRMYETLQTAFEEISG
jgi:hypothetical protein